MLATQMHFRSLEDVAAESATAVTADIERAGPITEEGFFKALPLDIRVHDTVFGGVVAPGTYRCQYLQGMPHRRGGTQVSPLIDGSGLELQTKAGDRRILLLKHLPEFAASCEILRMEPVENRDAVASAGRRGCCR